MIRRPTAGNGETVLYLGATEVHLTTGTTPKVTGTRYYSAGGQPVAVRTSTKGVLDTRLNFLAGDHHATASIAINATITNHDVVEPQTFTKRYTTPFGAPRGPQPAWPDDKRFLGKPVDANTGLTHIGAREYDPGIGRFISVDPVLDTSNAQSLNGYAYADNSPVTFSDPTGLLRPPEDSGTGSSCWDACQKKIDGMGSSSGGSGSSSGGGGDSGGSGGASSSSGGSTVTNSPKKSLASSIISGIGGGIKDFYQPYVDTYHDLREDPWGTTVRTVWGVVSSATPNGQAEAGMANLKKLYSAAKAAYDGDAEKAARIATERTITVTAAVLPLKVKLLPKAGCNRFAPSTLVLMADGTTKPIRDVDIGDRVLATDPETGETIEQEVTELHDNVDHEFMAVRIAADDGRRGVIRTTSHHSFWDDTRKKWTTAGELRVGNKLRTTTDHVVRVAGLRGSTGSRHMLDLTVANFHTYYVLAGTTPVLVHNTGPNCGIPVGGRRGDRLGGEDFHGSSYSLDEIVEFVNGHTGGGNPVMGRPSTTEVETTLRQAGPRQLEGQSSSKFDHNGVRVIVNWNMPWKSTSYYPGR